MLLEASRVDDVRSVEVSWSQNFGCCRLAYYLPSMGLSTAITLDSLD